MKKSFLVFLLYISLCNSVILFAQVKPEEINLETERFQDHFYEALKQKAIENYDLAILELEKCLALQPNNATILSEMGKNYLALKNYEKSYTFFENASKIEPNNQWHWAGMYEVCIKTKNLNQGLITLKKLIGLNDSYQDELVSLYMQMQQFDEALVLINKLNANFGKSEKRESFKTQILSKEKFKNASLNNLEHQVQLNPKDESEYVTLIKQYFENNEPQKATEIIKKLEKEIPNSEWIQLGLFTAFLNKNEGIKAINSMNLILESSQIDSKIKHKIFKDFLVFTTKNPQYSKDLEQAVNFFNNEIAPEVCKEIGKFFQTKKQFDKAVFYFEKHLKNNNNNNVEAFKLLIKAYIDNNQFANAVTSSATILESFPSEPELYYFSGYANIQLKEFKKAITSLETGLDFVVNNIQLEIDFNLQLSEAYKGLGDLKKNESYALKASQLLKTKK